MPPTRAFPTQNAAATAIGSVNKLAGRKQRTAAVVGEGATSEASLALVPSSAMPTVDPVYPIVSAILEVVPASRWKFARVTTDGDLHLVFASNENAKTLAMLIDEFKRQRQKAVAGPRIAATLGPLGDFTSGITLLFADARANFGILILLRTPDLGPFTATEIRVLTLALDAASERFSTLRLKLPLSTQSDQNGAEFVAEPSDGAFYVLNSDLEITLAWSSEELQQTTLAGLGVRIADRLPVILEKSVRALTAGWSSGAVNQCGIGYPVPFLVVRTRPMSGPAGLFIGVRIDRFQPPNLLLRAAARFHISPRELQVLALLLEGKHLDQIAEQLHITSSTVQDHIKSMLDKTESRNRSELIARVLGWDSPPSSPRA
jgi:DNA-binding CsgD family transcriptional regulator